MSKQTFDKSELFHDYILKYKDEAKSDPKEGYYHADIVAEAYTQGFSDGEKKGKKNFLNQLIKRESEKFTLKANQIYILSQDIIDYLRKNGYPVDSMHINLEPQCPKVILAVKSNLLVNDDFVKKAYVKLFQNKELFSKLFPEVLDIGLVSSDSLDKQLVKEAGFGYAEEY
ncbi:MAG: hypothetical protein WED10_02140 [Brumimicrobium sp.]